MRKWMSERLKRRKKPKDEGNKEATKAPEPLQPRFYDDNDSGAATAPVEPEVERVGSRHAPKQEPEVEAQSAPEPAGGTAALSAEGVAAVRPARRRRTRGGRGGSKRRQAAASTEIAAEPLAEADSEAATAGPHAELPAVLEKGQPLEAQGAQAIAQEAVAMPASAVPVPAAATPVRASKGTVVLAIGLPGSGKSSWFKRHNIHPLSSDLLRELLFDDAQEQRFQDLVFSNLRSMLKARLIARRPMNYVDATNLTPHDRHSWIKLAKDYGYDVQGVFFDVPLEICLERHQRRGRAVPEDVMRKMAGKLKPPTFEEGFSKITVVRVKQKEASAG